jgi:hypothetical protein
MPKQTYFFKVHAPSVHTDSDFLVAEVPEKHIDAVSAFSRGVACLQNLYLHNPNIKWAISIEEWRDTSKSVRKVVYSRKQVAEVARKTWGCSKCTELQERCQYHKQFENIYVPNEGKN